AAGRGGYLGVLVRAVQGDRPDPRPTRRRVRGPGEDREGRRRCESGGRDRGRGHLDPDARDLSGRGTGGRADRRAPEARLRCEDRGVARMTQTNTSPVTAAPKRLSTLDKWLPAWIGLAMVAGLLLGRFVPALSDGLSAMEIGGISVPIGLGLLVMMYPVLAKVRYD